MDERLVDLALNIHYFNQDVMELNIKYSEEIKELKDNILSLETKIDILESLLSETKADVKYALEYGDGNGYLRKKYFRGDNHDKEEN